MKQTLTHSRLATFRFCPHKHYIRYELGLVPDSDSLALRVGSAFHLALDTINKGGDLDAVMEAAVEDPYDLALVAAMVNAYQIRWADHQLESVESEYEFNLPLRNPETGAPTSVWDIAGVIDRMVRLPDGRLALKESKTTSQDFSPGSDYWTRLHLDQQLSIYVLAARQLGYEIDTILYDVTRRPGLRPLKATPEDKRKYKGNGQLYAKQRDRDETPAEYAMRVAEAIDKRPEHYFTRIEIARLDQDLEECAAELWQQQLAMRAAQKAGHWYRNPGACFSNFGACRYLPICTNRDLDQAVPAGFVRLDDIHPELAASGASPTRHAQASGQ